MERHSIEEREQGEIEQVRLIRYGVKTYDCLNLSVGTISVILDL